MTHKPHVIFVGDPKTIESLKAFTLTREKYPTVDVRCLTAQRLLAEEFDPPPLAIVVQPGYEKVFAFHQQNPGTHIFLLRGYSESERKTAQGIIGLPNISASESPKVEAIDLTALLDDVFYASMEPE